MNRKLKNEIAKVLEAPAPKGKLQFIHSLPHPHISTRVFVLNQIPFIKKSVWLLSALILLPALWGVYFASENTLWIVSTCIPFLALLFITESTKSTIYEMNELELATRFSLKSVVLARLNILGIFDFILFCILIPICSSANHISLFQTGLYLFIPYLLTTNISLSLVRHFSNKEVIYWCMAAAVLVSGTNISLHYAADFLFQTNYLVWWILTALLLFGTAIKELYQTFKKTEEIIWNYVSTD